jgi:hypothetical protein
VIEVAQDGHVHRDAVRDRPNATTPDARGDGSGERRRL